mgnify:CR=1 FL=1
MGWFDLHVHTRWSRDSLLDPREAAEAARRRGLAGIAITDHGEVLGCSEAMEVEGVAVIPGQEVRTAEGDLIVLMVGERIRPGRSLEETAEEARESGGILILPHPMDAVRRSSVGPEAAERAVRLVDAVEVVNGRTMRVFNDRAAELAERAGKPGLAGSDAHFRREVGSAAVLLGNGLLDPREIKCPRAPPLHLGLASWLLKKAKPRIARASDVVGDGGLLVDLADGDSYLVEGAEAVRPWGGRAELREVLSEMNEPVLMLPGPGLTPRELRGLKILERGLTTPWGEFSDAVLESRRGGVVTHVVVKRDGLEVPIPLREFGRVLP